ncbi:MAG TPA: insulinase family protein [Streptosporangiaceae bacterium]|nr:insulinase family protein [Streptosporangiaceae bacterium]
MEFTHTEVDGVPAFWTPAGNDLAAGLVFRVGRADETLTTAGITHMIEHLALHPLGIEAQLHYNGQVDDLTTTFVVRGSAAKIVSFFRVVCGSLHDLPAERLAKEKQVLRAEADTRVPVATAALLRLRYGAQTYGLSAFPEFGVARLMPPDLTRWAARWFTRGNAALWVAGGPPPAGLRLELPVGPPIPAPVAVNRLPATPAYCTAAVQGVCASGLVARSTAGEVYSAILRSRLVREVRHEQALSYSPNAAYVVRDREFAHVLAAADASPETRSKLVPAFLEVIERLAHYPVTEEELREVTESLRAAGVSPSASALRVASAARNRVMGRAALSIEDRQAELSALSAGQIQEVAADVLDSSLFAVPHGSDLRGQRFTRLPLPPDPIPTGRRIRSADYPFDRSRLVISRDRVALLNGATAASVRYNDCAALLTWPDGARQLIGQDGLAVHVEPTLWQTKAGLITAIDTRVGGDCLVEMPARPVDQLPVPRTSARRRAVAIFLTHPRAVAILGVVSVFALFLAVMNDWHADVVGCLLLLPAMWAATSLLRAARARLWRSARRKMQQPPMAAM